MVCPDCGRDNSGEASYCIDCGRAFKLICGVCEAKNSLDAKYCSACGTALGGESASATGPGAQVGRSLCPRCGSLNEAESRYCADCGLPLDESLARASAPYSSRRGTLPAWELGRPAGFWIRTAAALLDGLLLLFATAILTTLLFGQNYLDGLRDETVFWTNGDTLNVLLGAAYGILLVAAFSGTLGKLLLGMRIVRTDGSRVSLGTASLRYVAQYASLLLLGVGYLMIAFRRDKRGLHDLICDTAVVIVKG